MLTPEEIKKYKERLEKDRARLMGEIKSESRPTDFGSDIDNGDEEADEAEELADNLAASEVFKGRVNEIDSALAKIAAGTYGICEKCGKEIPKEVLDVVPESQYCNDCK